MNATQNTHLPVSFLCLHISMRRERYTKQPYTCELVTPSVFWNQESELNDPQINSQRCELFIHGH